MATKITKIGITNDKISGRVWRLNITQTEIILLGVDTMVLDNDTAKKREGNEPTYKRKKGFQPLHICWGSFLIDVMFRKGSAHSNHSTDYIDRVSAVVKLIRNRYSQDVPILICTDSGFADQKAYEVFEQQLTHFLFEAYKQDVTAQVIPVTVYPNTFRRMLIDFAVKICSHAGYTAMKLTRTIYQNINVEELWRLCQSPPKIQYA